MLTSPLSLHWHYKSLGKSCFGKENNLFERTLFQALQMILNKTFWYQFAILAKLVDNFKKISFWSDFKKTY